MVPRSPDPPPSAADARPSLYLVAGARATEAVLLDEVERHVEAARRDPSLLAKPLRVVVPSRPLRDHLAKRLVERCGGAVAGVALQTLHGLACDVLQRAGAQVSLADDLAPLLARREARADPALRALLEPLEDGYASIVGVVSDVLHAGFLEAHVEAIEDLLIEEAPLDSDPLEIVRARALVRVAARVATGLRRSDAGHGSVRFAAATARLEAADGAAALAARAVLVHGFADATGVALAFLRALARCAPCTILVDDPPDPGAAAGAPPPVGRVHRFAEPFVAALATVARVSRAESAPRAVPQITCLEAPGRDAEARAIAERVADLVEAGARPEGIAIVARSLEPVARPLRRHLCRLGVPHSSPTTLAWGERARRAKALVELLRRGGDAAPETWLEASALTPRLRAALRLGFHHLGLARLRDVAAFVPAERLGARAALALPGVAASEAGDDDDTLRRRRPSLPRSVLEAAIARAQVFLQSEPSCAPADRLDRHAARLGAALRGALLPATGADPAGAAVVSALLREVEALAEGRLAAFPLDGPELVSLLEARLRAAGEEPLGGAGGGIAVLDATAARALTFDHLFLMALERDVFPRPISDDPLLPDALRRVVRATLHDLPVKSLGFDEERHLFAELLSAAPAVTLSWSVVSDDGKPRSPSPLIERLRLAAALPGPAHVVAPFSEPRTGIRGRTACEHAQRAAMRDRHALSALLPLALAEGAAYGDAAEASALATARLAILALQEPPHSEAPVLTPYLGLVRPGERLATATVTGLESIASCGWRAFLERTLALEAAPDALGALPGLDGRLVGIVVHETLDHVARSGGARADDLEAALHATPSAPVWPASEELEDLLVEIAARVLASEGIAFPALAPALAARARAAVELVREDDQARGARVLAVEASGELVLPQPFARPGQDAPVRLRFRADRIERDGDTLVLVDFKTGRPLSEAKKPATRAHHLAARTAAGTALQASVYARAAAAASGTPAMGRYLYLRPGAELERIAIDARSDDVALATSFDTALRTVLEARAAGAFFPRLVAARSGREPDTCRHCAVAEACVRGDSGARARLVRFFEAERTRRPAADEPPAFASARALWSLGREADA